MKPCKTYFFRSIVLGLLLGISVFFLSFFHLISIPSCSLFFPLLILFGSAALLILVLVFLLSEHFKQIQDAYRCGGKTAIIGTAFLIPIALLACVWHWYLGIWFAVILGICFFFLTFILVGIFGMLHSYFQHKPTPPTPPRPKPEPPKPCPPPHKLPCDCMLMGTDDSGEE